MAIELTGSEPALHDSLASLRRGGDYRLVGVPANPVTLDLTVWVRTGPTIYNIHGRRIWRTWQQASDLVDSGRINMQPLVSHVVPLSEARSAFDLVLQGEAVKPLVSAE